MKLQRQTIFKLLSLLLIPISSLLVRWYSLAPESWEYYYSLNINKFFIQSMSLIYGIFPFSVFEVLAAIFAIGLTIYLIYLVIQCIKNIKKKQFLKTLGTGILNIGVVTSVLYFSFIFLWGLNYQRPQFGVKENLLVGEYTTEELSQLYKYLLRKAGKIRENLPEDENGIMVAYGDYRDIFERAIEGYKVVSTEFEGLGGDYGDAKPFLISEYLCYTGITGMYSPFTAEPNVNIAIPDMYIPSTTCHEMAHQRGYGFEDQCNFIAYITCVAHPDLDFQYSGYLLGISYISNALASTDFEKLVEANNTMMTEKVRNDLNAGNEFWEQYKGEVQEVSEQINSNYLKANGVESGVDSYGQVVDLLLAYYDKFFG